MLETVRTARELRLEHMLVMASKTAIALNISTPEILFSRQFTANY